MPRSWKEYAHSLIEDDIETLLAKGDGITKEQPKRVKRRFLPRGTRHKARITVVLAAAAVTVPTHDPGRTEKMRFNSATTARIEVK